MRYQHGYTQDDLMKTKNEDLEEEINNWRHNRFHGRRDKDASGEYLERESQLDIARHFAEWQKQKDFENLLKSDMTQFKKCYEKGRFDMREEMMKDTVEGIVGGHTDIPAFINLEIEHKPNVKVGDKVKIVVLKTE